MSVENTKIQDCLLRRYGEEHFEGHEPRSDALIIVGALAVGAATGSIAHNAIFTDADRKLSDISELKSEVAIWQRADANAQKSGYKLSDANANAIKKHDTKIATKEATIPLGGHYTETIGQISGVVIAIIAGASAYQFASRKTTKILEKARKRVAEDPNRDVLSS